MLFCPCQFLHEVDLPKGAQSPGPDPVQNRETAAHDPSALLAAIVTSSEDAIVSKTLDGIITTWNAGAARLYGYSETEAVGKPISMLAPPERADEIPSILQKIKNGERIEHYKSVRVTKNGRRLSVSITISPIRDAEGEIVGASAIARDVTELDQVRSNLQETASRAQALFQTAAQAIFIVDSSGTIVMANTATQAMFGYTVEELIGQSVDLLIPEQLRGRHKQHRDSYFERPQSRPMGVGLDLQGRRNDGTEFAAEISLSYMASSQGMLGVAFVSDISKRRADELAILRQREDLRALAAQLVSAQEDERRRIARNLHDDLGQTLAHLSIDMGRLAANPLAAEITAELRQLQQRANQASEAVRNISHQLHPSVLDDIGLEGALEQYCIDFEQRTGISTSFSSRNVPESLSPEIASGIYHITQECLRNASKHAQTDRILVMAEYADGVLRVSVEDKGVGLDSSDSSRKGIGMVGMRERAHIINASLSIDSKAGQGTKITVILPLVPPPSEQTRFA